MQGFYPLSLWERAREREKKSAMLRHSSNPILLQFAKHMRQQPTDAEALMWRVLRNRQMNGQKFRRQHPVAQYILDFYCDALRLAIELDGSQHHSEAGRLQDQARTEDLKQLGIRVIRFDNHDVLQHTMAVLSQIWQETLPVDAP